MTHKLPTVLAFALMAACDGGGDQTGVSADPTPTPVPPGAVYVSDNIFTPATISTDRQSTITWTWRGTAGHNVTFEDGQGSSPTQVNGDHQRAFGAAGTFRYRCTIHSSNFNSGMVGAVVVP